MSRNFCFYFLVFLHRRHYLGATKLSSTRTLFYGKPRICIAKH